jgi:hypothetical protein
LSRRWHAPFEDALGEIVTWEAVTSLSTLFTGAVIAVTAIAAVRQLRVAGDQSSAMREQLHHLRKATRFEGLLAIFDELDTAHQVEARSFVRFELADRIPDPAFRSQIASLGDVDERIHKEQTVLRCFERIGFYVKKDYVDADIVYMVAAGRVATMWTALQEVVAIQRSVAGPRFWENFEDLYHGCYAWMRRHGHTVQSLPQWQLAANGNEVQPLEAQPL